MRLTKLFFVILFVIFLLCNAQSYGFERENYADCYNGCMLMYNTCIDLCTGLSVYDKPTIDNIKQSVIIRDQCPSICSRQYFTCTSKCDNN